jgi:hypothetical protein
MKSVMSISSLYRLAGKEKEAKKLAVGFETFCVHNNAKTDRDLIFSTHGLCNLADRLDPAEADDFLLVWKPRENKDRSGHLGAIDGGITWRRYVHTQMAGIYRMLFGMTVPQKGWALTEGSGAAEVGARSDQGVQHDFKCVK